MSEALTLKSGHVFEPMTGPDWADAKNLFKAFARELKQVDVHLEGIKSLDDIKSLDAGVILKAFFQVAGSDTIEAAILACAKRSTLQGQKITDKTFEAPDMRRDYLPVAWEVMKLALLPFFEDLLSAFPTPEKAGTASLESGQRCTSRTSLS